MTTGKPTFPPNRVTPAVTVDWGAALPALPDPGLAGAVFVIIKGDRARVCSERYMADRIAEIWAGDAETDWDVLLVKTAKMPQLRACTVEADPYSSRATAVFRDADGFGHFAMNI